MITIDLGSIELYDAVSNEFKYKTGGIVRFEYSLKVVYDWESRWQKPFLSEKLQPEELKDFYMRMALDPIDEDFMTQSVMKVLSDYISNPCTATTFSSGKSKGSSGSSKKYKIYTAEELYAMMFTANIPIEFENRNLNRLFVILRIIDSYNSPPKKMNRNDIYKQNATLNAMRKKQLKTKG